MEKQLLRIMLSCALFGGLFCACAPGGQEAAATEQSVGAGEGDNGDGEVNEPAPELLLPAVARQEAPPVFKVRFETTKGAFVVQSTREWAPNGSDRLFNLVRVGYFNDVAFYRAVDKFIIQFGVYGDPEINALWSEAVIRDDPAGQPNRRGTIAFAQEGPNSRTTQLFVNLSDNDELNDTGFVPIAEVVEGMDVVDSLYTGYGELHPKGEGPRPFLLGRLGNTYLERQFPELDYIRKASFVQ